MRVTIEDNPNSDEVKAVYLTKEYPVEDEKKSSVWLTLLKLALVAAVLMGGVGLALWYAAYVQRFDDPNKPPDTPAKSWGIVNDSPIRPKL